MPIVDKICPWHKMLKPQFAINCATLFGLGNLKAPGTWGSAAGVLFFGSFFRTFDVCSLLILSLILCYFAVGICHSAEIALEEKDPGKINLDELAVIPLCFLPLNDYYFKSAFWLILGFGIFRFFDIIKPFGIKKLQSLDGGLGCVADDILAALYTCAVLNLITLTFA